MSKYGVFSGPYFTVFGANTERYAYLSRFSPNPRKYGPEYCVFGHLSRSDADHINNTNFPHFSNWSFYNTVVLNEMVAPAIIIIEMNSICNKTYAKLINFVNLAELLN